MRPPRGLLGRRRPGRLRARVIASTRALRAAVVLLVVAVVGVSLGMGVLVPSTGGVPHPAYGSPAFRGDARPLANGSGGCSNGTTRTGANGSVSLTACILQTAFYDRTQLQVALNVSGGTSPFQFRWYWGGGYATTTNGTTTNRSTGFVAFNYTISGNYSADFFVTDSRGAVVHVPYPISVVVPGGPLFVGLSATNVAGPGGSGVTQFTWSLAGGAGPYRVSLSLGDGVTYVTSTTNSSINPTGYLNHTYGPVPARTTYSVTANATDGAGTPASAAITVTPSYNVNSSCRGPSPSNLAGSCAYWANGSTVVLAAWNGTLLINATGVLQPPSSTSQLLDVSVTENSGNVSNNGLGLSVDPGVPNATHRYRTGSPALYLNLTVHQSYTAGGVYFLAVSGYYLGYVGNATNASALGNAAVSVPIPINLPSNGSGGQNGSNGSGNGHGGGHPAYPAGVNVTAAADPVTGTAPLTVWYSAYIEGGAPPFRVVWSLPGGSGAPNATGLSANDTYLIPGWYPATALVYNTTSPYGTVLVGVGSVWVDVLGANSSSGGGNGSNASRGLPHAPGGAITAGGAAPPTTFDTLLIAISIGGLSGAVVGFRLGRRTIPVPPARGEGKTEAGGAPSGRGGPRE